MYLLDLSSCFILLPVSESVIAIVEVVGIFVVILTVKSICSRQKQHLILLCATWPGQDHSSHLLGPSSSSYSSSFTLITGHSYCEFSFIFVLQSSAQK